MTVQTAIPEIKQLTATTENLFENKHYGDKDLAGKMESAALAYLTKADSYEESAVGMGELAKTILEDLRPYRGTEWKNRVEIWTRTMGEVSKIMKAHDVIPEKDPMSGLRLPIFYKALLTLPPSVTEGHNYYAAIHDIAELMTTNLKGQKYISARKDETQY